MTRIVLVALAALLFQAPVAPVPATAAISGAVMDGATKAPVENALVSISSPGQRQAGPQSRQLTDARGRFAFVNLPAATGYQLTAAKTGYLDNAYGRDDGRGAAGAPIALTEGQWFSDANIALQRPGAISGRLVDESGEPVAGVYVRALVQIQVAGRAHLAVSIMTTTDDRGMYRIHGLAPARYLVQVPSVQASVPAGTTTLEMNGITPEVLARNPTAAQFATTETAVEAGAAGRLVVGRYPIPPPPVAGRPMTYAAAFYGGTAVAQAVPIAVQFGEDRTGIDIRLEPVPASQLIGTVDGPAEALKGLTLRLLPAGLEDLASGSETATALVGPDGRFAFLNVPAGSYTIDGSASLNEYVFNLPFMQGPRFPKPPGVYGYGYSTNDAPSATPGAQFFAGSMGGARPYWARQTIAATGRDESNIRVTMRRAPVLSGRYVREPDPKQPPPATPSSLSVWAEPADGSARLGVLRPTGGPTDRSDQFEIQGLLPGEYFLRAPSYIGWIIKSITVDGHDRTDTPFDASTGQDFTGVVVTFTNASVTLSGFVHDAQGALAPGTAVVVFPAEPELRTKFGINPPRIKSVLVSSDGGYRFTGLPAGRYRLIAVRRAQLDAWRDPAFFTTAEAAALAVTLVWGEPKSQDLTLAVLR